jgi:hypothetical protein
MSAQINRWIENHGGSIKPHESLKASTEADRFFTNDTHTPDKLALTAQQLFVVYPIHSESYYGPTAR